MFNFQPIKSALRNGQYLRQKDELPEISVAEFAARVTGEALVSFERYGAISDLISRSVV